MLSRPACNFYIFYARWPIIPEIPAASSWLLYVYQGLLWSHQPPYWGSIRYSREQANMAKIKRELRVLSGINLKNIPTKLRGTMRFSQGNWGTSRNLKGNMYPPKRPSLLCRCFHTLWNYETAVFFASITSVDLLNTYACVSCVLCIWRILFSIYWNRKSVVRKHRCVQGGMCCYELCTLNFV